MSIKILSRRKWSIFSSIFFLSLAGACAGVAPMEKMAKLESQIATARQAEAITYAPLELKFAEDKYKQAQEAIKSKEYEKANRLAEQALLDAQLAEAKALSAKAEKQAQEMRESIEILRTEMQRMQN